MEYTGCAQNDAENKSYSICNAVRKPYNILLSQNFVRTVYICDLENSIEKKTIIDEIYTIFIPTLFKQSKVSEHDKIEWMSLSLKCSHEAPTASNLELARMGI